MIRAVHKLTAPLRRRVALMVGRAVLRAARDEGGLLLAQATLLDGEVRDRVPVIQEYGFASRPLAGAQGVIACAGGNRRGAMVIATGDRRYRLSLAAGEAAIHDDQGQKVHLTRAGIVIETANPVTVKGSAITLDADTTIKGNATVEGAVLAAGNVTAFSGGAAIGLDAVKATYNTHTHNENDAAPGPTAAPNEAI